jgi:hypothetical protein
VWEIEKHRVRFSREREIEKIICHKLMLSVFYRRAGFQL